MLQQRVKKRWNGEKEIKIFDIKIRKRKGT